MDNFEDFLREKHLKHYNGPEDEIVNDFELWLTVTVEVETIIRYAEEWGLKIRQK